MHQTSDECPVVFLCPYPVAHAGEARRSEHASNLPMGRLPHFPFSIFLKQPENSHQIFTLTFFPQFLLNQAVFMISPE